jgi:hypothetical protein
MESLNGDTQRREPSDTMAALEKKWEAQLKKKNDAIK